MGTAATSETQSYDLSIATGSRLFFFRNPNRGIALTDERIVWVFDGVSDSVPYRNVATVHLQSGGDWQNALSQCKLTFADRYILTVTNGNEFGAADADQSQLYSTFVRDLHARLAFAKPERPIRYMAGYQGARYVVVIIAAVLLGIIGVVMPFVLLFITGKLEVLFTLIGGIGLMWPLVKMAGNNMPRDYDPRALPNDLLP